MQVTNGDWVVDVRTGRPTMVTGRAKLVQDINENLTIGTQANGFGAGLENTIGLDVDPAGFRIEVQRRVRASISTLQRLQDRYLRNERAGSERVGGIMSLSVGEANIGGGTSRTGYSFKLRIRPVSGEVVVVGGAVS